MLLHHPDHFYIVKMKGDRDGSVQCTLFAKDATGMFTCAWPDCVFRCQPAILRVLGKALVGMQPPRKGASSDAE